jgi:hypothetical protein
LRTHSHNLVDQRFPWALVYAFVRVEQLDA